MTLSSLWRRRHAPTLLQLKQDDAKRAALPQGSVAVTLATMCVYYVRVCQIADWSGAFFIRTVRKNAKPEGQGFTTTMEWHE